MRDGEGRSFILGLHLRYTMTREVSVGLTPKYKARPAPKLIRWWQRNLGINAVLRSASNRERRFNLRRALRSVLLVASVVKNRRTTEGHRGSQRTF